jgi:hypothetical protein
MKPTDRPWGPLHGCVYGLLIAVVGGLLFLVNGAVMLGVHFGLRDLYPPGLDNPRFGQLIIFLGTVVLAFTQWRLVDYVVDRLRRPPQDVH